MVHWARPLLVACLLSKIAMWPTMAWGEVVIPCQEIACATLIDKARSLHTEPNVEYRNETSLLKAAYRAEPIPEILLWLADDYANVQDWCTGESYFNLYKGSAGASAQLQPLLVKRLGELFEQKASDCKDVHFQAANLARELRLTEPATVIAIEHMMTPPAPTTQVRMINAPITAAEWKQRIGPHRVRLERAIVGLDVIGSVLAIGGAVGATILVGILGATPATRQDDAAFTAVLPIIVSTVSGLAIVGLDRAISAIFLGSFSRSKAVKVLDDFPPQREQR